VLGIDGKESGCSIWYVTYTQCVKTSERGLTRFITAIVLECVKLLADMDPILLSSFSSQEDENPFQVLSWYLNASNHNLKYLGLIGMAYIDQSFWKEDWIRLLGEAIRTCYEDDTIITQAIENLDSVVDFNILKVVTPGMMEALSRNYDLKSCNTTIGYWLMNRIVEYGKEEDAWLVQSIISILAETRRNLDDDYVETQCSLLRQGNFYIWGISTFNFDIHTFMHTHTQY
jgi:hypothetical protein